MTYRIIGRCSLCGGNVTLPETWAGTQPPTPGCMNCGAVKRNDLPVIDMVPRPTKIPPAVDLSKLKDNTDLLRRIRAATPTTPIPPAGPEGGGV